MNLDLVTNYIRESKHLVCLVGNKLQEECGVPRLRVQEVAYEVESKYGYSPEEILSSVFFVTRPEMFTNITGTSFLATRENPVIPIMHWQSLREKRESKGHYHPEYFRAAHESRM